MQLVSVVSGRAWRALALSLTWPTSYSILTFASRAMRPYFAISC